VNKMQTDGRSASTIQNTLDPVRVICRRAIEDDVVTVNPTRHLRLRKTRKRKPRIAEPSHALALLEALPEIEDRALWACALYAGLRRGELRALRWSDVDRAAGEINVRRGWDDEEEEEQGLKSHAGERTVPIFDTLGPLLAELKIRTGRDGADLVFGATAERAFMPSTVRSRALRAWKAAGLEPIGLHEARHTFASVAISSGVKDLKRIQVWMGHATMSMTTDT
jgi:integrase